MYDAMHVILSNFQIWATWENADSQESLKRDPIYHDITYGTVITVAKSGSDYRITTYTPYLALTGELWVVCCEDFGENRPCFNGTALYLTLYYSEVTWGCRISDNQQLDRFF